jgi:hypothetical protein
MEPLKEPRLEPQRESEMDPLLEPQREPQMEREMDPSMELQKGSQTENSKGIQKVKVRGKGLAQLMERSNQQSRYLVTWMGSLWD